MRLLASLLVVITVVFDGVDAVLFVTSTVQAFLSRKGAFLTSEINPLGLGNRPRMANNSDTESTRVQGMSKPPNPSRDDLPPPLNVIARL